MCFQTKRKNELSTNIMSIGLPTTLEPIVFNNNKSKTTITNTNTLTMIIFFFGKLFMIKFPSK